jgi:hypothetical protein
MRARVESETTRAGAAAAPNFGLAAELDLGDAGDADANRWRL